MQLKVQVTRIYTDPKDDLPGIRAVKLLRASGDLEVVRNVPDVAILVQPTQPTREISLPRRSLRDCLSEDLRRLDPDVLFGRVLVENFNENTPTPVLSKP
jgi:hypothetical protein